MDARATKLEIARRKLRDHQEKKGVISQKEELAQHDEHTEFVGSGDQTENNKNILNDERLSIISDQVLLQNDSVGSTAINPNINLTEFFISNERHLETQLAHLNTKLNDLESNNKALIENVNALKKRLSESEEDVKNLQNKNKILEEDVLSKQNTIQSLSKSKDILLNENNNIRDQLEVTKNILFDKESDNSLLQSQLSVLIKQVDELQLQLDQLNSGYDTQLQHNNNQEKTESYLQKISNLNQQIKTMQKENDQIKVHYENYVQELDQQLKFVFSKNKDLSEEITNRINRENDLIKTISNLERRMQSNSRIIESHSDHISDTKDLQSSLIKCQEELKESQLKYDKLQQNFLDCQTKLKEFYEEKKADNNAISITQLNADITSDKVALQRAMEQNKKLKLDLQNLEEDFVKMSQDKLELTEKLTAEKYLNRELTIKLSEVELNAKEMHKNLLAKDQEMIRLQSSYRDAEEVSQKFHDHTNSPKISKTNSTNELVHDSQFEEDTSRGEIKSQNTSESVESKSCMNVNIIHKEDAMLKLQDRFYKIMEEVADLSDEKHRLEHIITQLQNETDTICEYVALYQQQRSLLKKRDEERNAQIKIFQSECDQLRSQIEELNGVLIKLANDKELASYFLEESRNNDINKIMSLLANIKNNTIVDFTRSSIELKSFHPCNCCSGKLIHI